MISLFISPGLGEFSGTSLSRFCFVCLFWTCSVSLPLVWVSQLTYWSVCRFLFMPLSWNSLTKATQTALFWLRIRGESPCWWGGSGGSGKHLVTWHPQSGSTAQLPFSTQSKIPAGNSATHGLSQGNLQPACPEAHLPRDPKVCQVDSTSHRFISKYLINPQTFDSFFCFHLTRWFLLTCLYVLDFPLLPCWISIDICFFTHCIL